MLKKSHNAIREWLLPKLAARDMSVAQLATAVGVSRAAVYLYLNDQSRPTGYHMARICQVLGVPIEEGLSKYIPRRPGRPRKRRF